MKTWICVVSLVLPVIALNGCLPKKSELAQTQTVDRSAPVETQRAEEALDAMVRIFQKGALLDQTPNVIASTLWKDPIFGNRSVFPYFGSDKQKSLVENFFSQRHLSKMADSLPAKISENTIKYHETAKPILTPKMENIEGIKIDTAKSFQLEVSGKLIEVWATVAKTSVNEGEETSKSLGRRIVAGSYVLLDITVDHTPLGFYSMLSMGGVEKPSADVFVTANR